jgi:hypothetical protein
VKNGAAFYLRRASCPQFRGVAGFRQRSIEGFFIPAKAGFQLFGERRKTQGWIRGLCRG